MRALATRRPSVNTLLLALSFIFPVAPALGQAQDRRPPEIHLSLEWVPQGYNRLLVIPPGGFAITVRFDADDGTPINLESLQVTSDFEIAGVPVGEDLSRHFTVTDAGATWRVPADADLTRTSHWVRVGLRDEAGNQSYASLRFAVRDFAFGAPLAGLQPIHIDFTRDRHADDGDDFEVSLRHLGLSSPEAGLMGTRLRNQIEAEIVARVRSIYGIHPDGSRTPNSVNVSFTHLLPSVPYARICVGGTHPRNATALGAVPLDLDNLEELRDDCKRPDEGVFPDAVSELWRDTGLYRRTFAALTPVSGGTPVGLHSLDSEVLAKGFRFASARPEAQQRFIVLMDAFDVFVQTIAVVTAHEIGHMLGLTAPGPAPRGHFGGTHGVAANHNVTQDGESAAGNFIMNRGGSFSLASISGREGHPLPRFRPISWAYLHNRIVRNERVQSLRPAPVVTHALVTRDETNNSEAVLVQVRGRGFSEMASLELVARSDGFVYPVPDAERLSGRSLLGRIPPKLLKPGLYDVFVVGGDEQSTRLAEPIQLPPAE
jgi:hypothetical protein